MSQQPTPTSREDRQMDEQNIDTLVIGGGQTGLTIGYELAQTGRTFLILDAHKRLGEAWRTRWDSLVLFTPSGFFELPGMRFPAPADHFVSKDEVADFLGRRDRSRTGKRPRDIPLRRTLGGDPVSHRRLVWTERRHQNGPLHGNQSPHHVDADWQESTAQDAREGLSRCSGQVPRPKSSEGSAGPQGHWRRGWPTRVGRWSGTRRPERRLVHRISTGVRLDRPSSLRRRRQACPKPRRG